MKEQKVIHYIDAVQDIEVWNWFCKTFNSEFYINNEGNHLKLWKYFMLFSEGFSPTFVADIIEDNETQKFVKLTLEEFKQKYLQILGYKAPFDMFDGKVKKGDIYRFKDTLYVAYSPDSPNWEILGSGLPKEIVQRWEVIYK